MEAAIDNCQLVSIYMSFNFWVDVDAYMRGFRGRGGG